MALEDPVVEEDEEFKLPSNIYFNGKLEICLTNTATIIGVT
jgi:hypothetical protein